MLVRRQGPQRVHVIWQEHPCLDDKGVLRANRGNTGPQCGAHVRIGQKRLSLKRIDGEEVRTAIHPSATVIGHGKIIHRLCWNVGRA